MAVVIPDETLYAAHLTAAELKQELAVLLLIDERRGRLVALPRGRSVGARIGNHQGAKRPSEHERRRIVPPFGQNIA